MYAFIDVLNVVFSNYFEVNGTQGWNGIQLKGGSVFQKNQKWVIHFLLIKVQG